MFIHYFVDPNLLKKYFKIIYRKYFFRVCVISGGKANRGLQMFLCRTVTYLAKKSFLTNGQVKNIF